MHGFVYHRSSYIVPYTIGIKGFVFDVYVNPESYKRACEGQVYIPQLIVVDISQYLADAIANQIIIIQARSFFYARSDMTRRTRAKPIH